MKKVKFGGQVSKNVIMLYVMNITQLVLPLVTLPYLARVFSLNIYGVVSYTKNVMIYVNLFIEFGYLLFGTKEVVEAREDKKKLGQIIGEITQAKIVLSFSSLVVMTVMIFSIDMLHEHIFFTYMMVIPQILSIFLYDYLFRGLEKMQIITVRFLIMRGISTLLTFIVVRDNADMILIPFLDILGTLIAVVWVNFEIKKLGIKLEIVGVKKVMESLRGSLTYFTSNIATTAFSAFNTIVVGIILGPTKVAFWTMLMSLVIGVQGLYSPISDGIYPHMIKTKSLSLFRKILLIFSPILILGCLFTFTFARFIVSLIGGHKYVVMYPLLQLSVPLLFVSFYSILCGWPLLGAINKVKQTTLTTLIASFCQVMGVALLAVSGTLTLPSLVILRIISESVLLLSRLFVFYRNRQLYME